MKKIKILTLLALIASISVFFPACSDEPDTTITPAPSKTNTQIISSSPWTLTQVRGSGDNGATWTDVTAFFDPCELDNTWSFGTDGKITIDEGSTKCNPQDPQTETVPWSFANNETKINIDGDLLDISLLDESTLRVTELDGTDITEITFSR